MRTVEPDPDRLSATLAALPPDTPVVMLNLLRFREQAAYADPAEACSGREAYLKRYSVGAAEHVAAVGGEVRYLGEARGVLIGPETEAWDLMLLVRYPSAEAFGTMIANPDYQQYARHRTAALLDSRLVATIEP